MIPVAYNFRSLAVRKTTTVATAGGIALVVFVFSSVMMLSNGIKKTMGRSGSPDVAVVLRKGADAELASNLDEPQVGLLKAAREVKVNAAGQPEGVGELMVVITQDKVGAPGVSNVQTRGVPDNVHEFRKEVHIIAGEKARPGTDEVIVGKAIRGRFKGMDLGQTFELKKNRPVKVVGIFSAGGSSYESEVWTDLATLRATFGREGIVSSVRVRLQSPDKFEAFKTTVESDRQLGLEVQRETVYYEKQSEGTAKFISGMGFVVAFFFSLGAMIGAMNTMYSSVDNRQREIGTLRALGFSRTSILGSFILEAILLALIGGVVGAIASLGMGLVKFSTMNFASWSEIVFNFEPTGRILVQSMVFAAVMGLFGGFLPAVRAARMSPVKAMRGG